MILSHKKARALRSWDRVNEALEKEEIIKGFVKCRTKGGLIADVFGIEAFLPGSQIDVKPIRDYDVYVGKIMEFKVVKINKEFKKSEKGDSGSRAAHGNSPEAREMAGRARSAVPSKLRRFT